MVMLRTLVTSQIICMPKMPKLKTRLSEEAVSVVTMASEPSASSNENYHHKSSQHCCVPCY